MRIPRNVLRLSEHFGFHDAQAIPFAFWNLHSRIRNLRSYQAEIYLPVDGPFQFQAWDRDDPIRIAKHDAPDVPSSPGNILQRLETSVHELLLFKFVLPLLAAFEQRPLLGRTLGRQIAGFYRIEQA